MRRMLIRSCLLAALVTALVPVWAEATWQAHEDIEAAAVEAVRTQSGGGAGRLEIVADPLDPRVRLSSCGQSLGASVPFKGRRQASRFTVEVRCAGPDAWKIYVPVRLASFQQVLVASRALPRGTVLTPGDISLAEEDISSLGYGYLAAPEHAVGHRLRRALNTGDVMTPNMLEVPALVRRGQRLTLEAKSGGLTVRMAGIAKSDGVRGQIIDVENLTSKRLVQAIVRSPQFAEVLLQ